MRQKYVTILFYKNLKGFRKRKLLLHFFDTRKGKLLQKYSSLFFLGLKKIKITIT